VSSGDTTQGAEIVTGGFVVELFLEAEGNKSVFRASFSVRDDGMLVDGTGTIIYHGVLDFLNRLVVFCRPLSGGLEEIAPQICARMVFPPDVDRHARVTRSKLFSFLKSSDDKLFSAHPNLKTLIANGRSKVVYGGKIWEVSADEQIGGRMIAVTMTDSDTSETVSFFVYRERNGEELVSRGGEGGHSSEFRDFLNRLTDIRRAR
jgi:hypothetical protein